MPGPLTDPCEKVISKILIDGGLGSDPTQSGLNQSQSWPCFYSKEPDGPGIPDNVITVYGTSPIMNGKDAFGEVAEYNGILIRVRSSRKDEGHGKMDSIREFLDRLYMRGISVGDNHYTVQNVRRTSGPTSIGKESAPTARNIHTLNVLVTIRMNSTD